MNPGPTKPNYTFVKTCSPSGSQLFIFLNFWKQTASEQKKQKFVWEMVGKIQSLTQMFSFFYVRT